MKSHGTSELNRSFWLESASSHFPTLREAISVDVAIVGGGVTGLTAAYLAKKAGFTVALLERGLVCGADSGHTTAHLTYVTDCRLSELVRRFGRDHGAAVWDAGKHALEQIHTLVEDEGIQCEFRHLGGILHRGKGGVSEDDLKAERELAADAGFDCAFLERTPLFGDPGIKYFSQALFHPKRYLDGLAARVNGDGSHVFENTNITEFDEDPLTVRTEHGKVSCGIVLVATGNPLQATRSTTAAALFQTKLYAYSSYVVRAELPESKWGDASYWDTAEPYNYLRLDQSRRGTFATLGGADVKTGQEHDHQQRFAELEHRLQQIFGYVQPTHRWLGQVLSTPDGLPYIGIAAEGCFIGTGYAGNGYTFGTLAASMFVDHIRNVKNPWTELFDPHRKALKAGAWNYLRENLDYPYYMVKDRLQRDEAREAESLQPGEGVVTRHDGRRVAAYRAPNGKLSLLSPSCTHLGCMVRWNSADSTWDCPCHGSRFSATGEVLAGPAEAPLQQLEYDTVPSGAST